MIDSRTSPDSGIMAIVPLEVRMKRVLRIGLVESLFKKHVNPALVLDGSVGRLGGSVG